MWIKLSGDANETWINSKHIARVDFQEDAVTVTTIKSSGSDRSIFRGSDIEILREALKREWELENPNIANTGPR